MYDGIGGAKELHTKVIDLRDTFTMVLDTEGEHLDGMLRIKMAKAELLLNRIGLLLEKDNG